MKKKIFMFCNTGLIAMAVLSAFLVFVCCGVVIFLVGQESVTVVDGTPLGVQILFLCLGIGYFLSLLSVSPRTFDNIVLSENCVDYRIPFHPTTSHPYKYYPFVFQAKYFHGNIFGMGYYVHFIVLSHRRLSSIELLHANTLPVTEDIIKIKYSKRTFKKLISILPPEHKHMLNSAFQNNP